MKRPLLAAVVVAAAAAPATASAASLEIAAPDGTDTIVYQAQPGEVNAVEMVGTVDGGLDLRMEFFEYAAPLAAGPGCVGGFPTVCGKADQAFPVAVSFGDEDDVANVNSFASSTTMNAGSGDDDVLAGGIDATAAGGAGDDTIHLAANNLTTGDGGTGRDRIAAGLGAAAAILTGGTNADLLVPGGFMFNDAKGGSGNDRLVSFTGSEVALAGQSGSDTLVASTGNGSIELAGGSGGDTAFSHLGGVTVDAGSGDDVVEVQGGGATAADTVACGTGFDLVWADAADSVAADCELVIRRFKAPTLRKVTGAVDAANALRAHRPEPSKL